MQTVYDELINANQVYGLHIKDYQIRIKETDKGVIIDVLNASNITGKPLKSLFLFDNDYNLKGE
jgi:hypothetical protein